MLVDFYTKSVFIFIFLDELLVNLSFTLSPPLSPASPFRIPLLKYNTWSDQ